MARTPSDSSTLEMTRSYARQRMSFYWPERGVSAVGDSGCRSIQRGRTTTVPDGPDTSIVGVLGARAGRAGPVSALNHPASTWAEQDRAGGKTWRLTIEPPNPQLPTVHGNATKGPETEMQLQRKWLDAVNLRRATECQIHDHSELTLGLHQFAPRLTCGRCPSLDFWPRKQVSTMLPCRAGDATFALLCDALAYRSSS
jgi:hypothetical protein